MTNNNYINGKNFIITGASTGIGEKIAGRIASKGGNLILIARSEEKLKQIQENLVQNFSIKCSYYAVDLTNNQLTNMVFKDIINSYERIDAMINNAGMGVFDTVLNSQWTNIEQMVQLNVLSLINATHQLLPHFIENKAGHIINIGSQAGKIATPKSAVYSATKHAVIGFSNALRLEVQGNGIHVTTVNLGPVRTNFFTIADPTGNYQQAMNRYMLDPERVASKIVQALFTRRREINMPKWMDIGSKFYIIFPTLMERLLKRQFNKK